MKPISYGKQHISQEDINSVVEVLKSDFLTQGPKADEFEKKFASYVGSKYAISVTNGTAALHLSALALGVKKGDKIITTPNSFVATSNCIEYCKGEIEFCDIEPNTMCLDIDLVRKKLEKFPKGTFVGIIPVNFAGYPVNMEKFRDIANEFGLWLLEDSCHSPGGFFIDSKGDKQNCGNGNFADVSIFSFHPVKHITTGEGGMITTNSLKLYEKIKILRTHGIIKNQEKFSKNESKWYYEMITLGYNYRLSDIHCALGISQLKKAKLNIEKRKHLAERYIEAFTPYKNEIFFQETCIGHAYHLFVIQVNEREELYNYLKKKNINCQIHYIPIHKQPYYSKKYGDKKFKISEKYYGHCLSLPLYPSLKNDEQEYVINSILEFYE